VHGDGVQVRGLTVTGDAFFTGDLASLVEADVWGHLDVLGDDAIVADARVFGDLRVLGLGALLAHNGIQGDSEISADALEHDTYAFVE
jgi:hypothetical protein